MKKEGRGGIDGWHKRGWVRADGTPLANSAKNYIIYVDASYVVNTFNEFYSDVGELIAFITLFENAPFRPELPDTVQFVDAVIPVPKESGVSERITTVGYKKVPQDVKCIHGYLFNNGDLEDSQAYSHHVAVIYTDGSHTESPKGSGAGNVYR
ncbi:putative ribonuclease H [Salmonella phage SPFM1]|nr:putative ribonuclease H [Salmonella phage SPFM1]